VDAQTRATPSVAARERRAEAKRAAILGAAQQVFLADGFEAATMDAIAAKASVSKQTLYRYHASKEDLFTAVLQTLTVQRFWHDVPEALDARAVDSRPDVQALLTSSAHSIVTHLMQPTYLALLRILIAEAPRFPDLAAQFHTAVIAQGEEALAGIVQRAERAGVLAPTAPDLVARLLVGALLTYVFADGLLTPGDQPRPPDTETITALVQLVLRALPWR
jgi:TetR/AcrR family transcriptional repressor of mexJK operon